MWRLQRSLNLVGVMAIAGAMTCAAPAATVTVPAQYATIQDAIDICVDDDIVLVSPGVYNELIDFQGKAIMVTSIDLFDEGVVMTTIIAFPILLSSSKDPFNPGNTMRSVTVARSPNCRRMNRSTELFSWEDLPYGLVNRPSRHSSSNCSTPRDLNRSRFSTSAYPAPIPRWTWQDLCSRPWHISRT